MSAAVALSRPLRARGSARGAGGNFAGGHGFRSQTFPDKLVSDCRRVAQLVRALP